MVLTCWSCNNLSSRPDSHARNMEDILEFASGAATRVIPVEVSLADFTFRARLTADEDHVHIASVPEANHPETNTRLTEVFEKGVAIKEHTLTFRRKFHYQIALVSWLRAGYLAVFAALGYRYIGQRALQIVRDQILKPGDDVIARYSMTITAGHDFEKRILIVSDPAWMSGSIIVNFGRHADVLPGVDAEVGFYDRLAASIPSDGKLDGEISGKSPDWPTKAVYLLDN